MNKFCENLKYLLKEKNKTPTEIAEIINVGKSSVYNWINGYNEPKLKELIKLAEYFEVSIDYLVGIEN